MESFVLFYVNSEDFMRVSLRSEHHDKAKVNFLSTTVSILKEKVTIRLKASSDNKSRFIVCGSLKAKRHFLF